MKAIIVYSITVNNILSRKESKELCNREKNTGIKFPFFLDVPKETLMYYIFMIHSYVCLRWCTN